MTLSVDVIYGALGFLILCQANAQYNGFETYYNQDEYYKQYPQYTQAQANAYHGYTTPQALNSNPNSVQVIEVSIPDISMTNGKQDGSLLKGVISQLLSQAGSAIPYTFSVHTYSDKKTPFINPQSIYGSQSSSSASSSSASSSAASSSAASSSSANPYIQSHTTNNKQVAYYQQQQYEYNLKHQQYQKELDQYEQKLREYYAKYPSALPQQTTTSLPIIKVTESIKPNEIKPITHVPILDNGKSLAELLLANQGDHDTQSTGQSSGDFSSNQNKEPSDGKSLLELINENSGQTEGGKPLVELIGHQPSSSTEDPKNALDDLIKNIFTDKPHEPTGPTGPTEPTSTGGGGKSLFELLAELPPEPEDSKEIVPSKSTESNVDESTQQGKKNSDVAGGDYGLDVRTGDNKTKRVKRNILRRMAEHFANFRNHDSRHDNDHECNHNERRNHHSHHNHGHGYGETDEYDGFSEQHGHNEWHDGRGPSHKHHHSNSDFVGHHMNGYEHHTNGYQHNTNGYEHHSRPHHNNDHEIDKDSNPDHNQKPRPFKEEGQPDESLKPSEKPISVDMALQTDLFDNPRSVPSEPTKDPTLDIDIRGGFEETRTKRHNLKRTRRSPQEEEEIVFQDEDETKSKVEAEAVETEKVEEKASEKADNVEEKASDSESTNSTETGGDEKGELDSRFGLFGGGGGFHRQAPGRNPIGTLIGGVVGGVFGGLNGLNQGYDPYNRPPGPQYPQYPQYSNQHGHHPPDYVQQQQYGYGNNYPPPPPPQQPPVHIHINNIANAQSQATNTALGPHGIGSDQNAAANAQSQNYQNEFGAFQNTGASGQASNLGHDGSGQLSAANAMNQNYQNQFGSGSKNNAQSQSANFDPHGNLALTSSNSGTNHFAGPDGVRDETNSAAQSSLQGQFGTQNSGAQSNTYQGPNGSGSSASSQASSVNNGYGSQNSGSNAAANSGNVGGSSFGNAQSQTYANDQWGW